MSRALPFVSLRMVPVVLSLVLLLSGCGGGGGSSAGTTAGGTTAGVVSGTIGSTPASTLTTPRSVTGGQAGYAASVPSQTGCTYAWTVTNGTIMVGDGTESIAFTPNTSGDVTITCTVTNAAGVSATSTTTITVTAATPPAYNITQALSDLAQSTTMAFSGFGMMTGNLGAQTFFPPGKVADYWGFQCLRDNDADSMGHNTSFLTRVSSNVLYILNDAQLAALKKLAASQVSNINLYAWKRYPLMKAFRRLMDGNLPAGTAGLSLAAVKTASVDLYLLDGQLSYERAVVYADIYRSLTADQKTYLSGMVGKGYNSWPSLTEADVASKTQGLSNDEVVAVMSYAGDLFSWYNGSLTSDVYFCPERHGTYFGSFYIKDAPAVNHPGYGISVTMTAEVGGALCDSTKNYISADGAAKMNALVATQKQNLYGNATSNIVLARTKISEALRSLISSTAPPTATLAQVKSTVDTWSAIYGDLDGENNYNYATTYYQLYNNVGNSAGATYITAAQKTALAALRTQCMTVTYADGTTVDFSSCSKYFLFAAEVLATSTDFTNYTSDTVTDPFFTP